MSELGNYLTITEAAELRGVSRQAIFELIKRGRLKATRLGRQWLIRKSDVRRFKAKPAGRPPQSKK